MINFCLQSHRPILYLKRQQKVHPAKRFENLRSRQHGLLRTHHYILLWITLWNFTTHTGTQRQCTRAAHSQCAVLCTLYSVPVHYIVIYNTRTGNWLWPIGFVWAQLESQSGKHHMLHVTQCIMFNIH